MMPPTLARSASELREVSHVAGLIQEPMAAPAVLGRGAVRWLSLPEAGSAYSADRASPTGTDSTNQRRSNNVAKAARAQPLAGW